MEMGRWGGREGNIEEGRESKGAKPASHPCSSQSFLAYIHACISKEIEI